MVYLVARVEPRQCLRVGRVEPLCSDFEFIEAQNCTEQGVLTKPNLFVFGNFC